MPGPEGAHEHGGADRARADARPGGDGREPFDCDYEDGRTEEEQSEDESCSRSPCSEVPAPPKPPTPPRKHRHRSISASTEILGATPRRDHKEPAEPQGSKIEVPRYKRQNASKFDGEAPDRDHHERGRRGRRHSEEHKRAEKKDKKDKTRKREKNERRSRSRARDDKKKSTQPEEPRREKSTVRLTPKYPEPLEGEYLHCSVCKKAFGLPGGQFALSQHFWSKHPDTNEAKERSAFFYPKKPGGKGKSRSLAPQREGAASSGSNAQATPTPRAGLEAVPSEAERMDTVRNLLAATHMLMGSKPPISSLGNEGVWRGPENKGP